MWSTFSFLIKINVKHVERSCQELNKECDEFLIQLSSFLSELFQVETLMLTHSGHMQQHTSLEQSLYKCIVATEAQVSCVAACPEIVLLIPSTQWAVWWVVIIADASYSSAKYLITYNMTLLMAIWCPHIWTEVSSPITNGPCFEIVNKETQFILKCCFQKWTDNARIVEEYKINSPFPSMPEPQYTCFEKFKQRANSYAVVCVFQVCIIVKYNTSPVPPRPPGLQT